MWILSWKKYALSKFATFISVVAALLRYAGVMCLVSTLIPAGLICLAIGIGLHFCAETLAKSKVKKAVDTVKNANTANSAMPAAKSTSAKSAQKPAQPVSAPSTTAQTATVTDEKIKCNKCGALVSNNNKFCTDCGNALINAAPKLKKCLRCGETVADGNKFCSNCGYEIQ